MALIDKTMAVAADVQDVYEVWAAFEDYPEFMETIEAVTIVADGRLHGSSVVRYASGGYHVTVAATPPLPHHASALT
jgi:uncharacterized membrane protein